MRITLANVECRTYGECIPYMVKLLESGQYLRKEDEANGLSFQIQYPRLSYLPFLFEPLHTFFASQMIDPEVESHEAWFECEGVPLKWQHTMS